MLGFINMPAGGELMIIGLVALIALGPEQLPSVMRKLGALSSQLRSLSTNLKQEFLDGLEESSAVKARRDLAQSEQSRPAPDAAFDPTQPIVPHGYAERMAAESSSTPPADPAPDRPNGADAAP